MAVLETHEQLELIGEDGDFHCYYCGKEMSYAFRITRDYWGNLLGPACMPCFNQVVDLIAKYRRKVGSY